MPLETQSGKGDPLWTITKRATLEGRSYGFSSRQTKIRLPSDFAWQPWQRAVAWCEDLFLPPIVYPSTVYEGLGESQLTADGAAGP